MEFISDKLLFVKESKETLAQQDKELEMTKQNLWAEADLIKKEREKV